MSKEKETSFANPGPAGLMVLSFYLVCLWSVATHQAPPEMVNVLIPLGFAGGIVQLVAGIIDLKNGEVMTGNIMLAFSTFMWLGFWEFLGKALGFIPQNTALADGWVFLVMGILMSGFTIGYLRAPKVAFWFMIFTDIFFLSGGIFFLTSIKEIWLVTSWDIPLVIIAIIWLVLGLVLNSVFEKTVIPLGEPYYRGGE